jgi:hypothetical protein
MLAAADRLPRMLVAMKYGIAASDLAAIDHTRPTVPLRFHTELGRHRWKVVQPKAKTAKAA